MTSSESAPPMLACSMDPTASTRRGARPAVPLQRVTRTADGVRGRLELPSTVLSAGNAEEGALVLDNPGAERRVLTTVGAIRCAPKWGVVLRNEMLPQVPAYTSDCRTTQLVLQAGQTRLQFTLVTTYEAMQLHGSGTGAHCSHLV